MNTSHVKKCEKPVKLGGGRWIIEGLRNNICQADIIRTGDVDDP